MVIVPHSFDFFYHIIIAVSANKQNEDSCWVRTHLTILLILCDAEQNPTLACIASCRLSLGLMGIILFVPVKEANRTPWHRTKTVWRVRRPQFSYFFFLFCFFLCFFFLHFPDTYDHVFSIYIWKNALLSSVRQSVLQYAWALWISTELSQRFTDPAWKRCG